ADRAVDMSSKPVFMRSFALHSDRFQLACDTTSASLFRSDRYRRSATQTPRGSTAHALLGHGPVQPASFHAPRANPKAVAIEDKNLHAIAPFIGEQKQMTALRILFELANDKSIKAIESQSHIGIPGCHKDARGCAHP